MRTLLTALILTTATPASAQLIAEQNGADLRPFFEPHGFTDIEVTSRRIDRIDAEVCRGEERWATTLTLLSGRVEAREKVGDCTVRDGIARRADEGGRPLPRDEEDIAMRALEGVGYTGVQLRRWGRGQWRGTACRDGKLREVRVSNGGIPSAPLRAMRDCPEGRETQRKIVAGPPPEPPIRHVRDVKARLERRAYTEVGRIEIKDGAYHAETCKGGWRFVVTMRPDGEIVRRRNVGRCEVADAAGATAAPAGGDEG